MTYLCDITRRFPRIARLLCGIVSITFIWLVAVYIVNPTGNFPLNDDWSFGTTALTYYRTGQYVPGDFPAMSLITNVVLAIPFIHFLGDTFESLRVSSLFYHWLTAVLVYCMAVRRLNVFISTLVACSVLFSPIAFISSFTFMTESIFQLLSVTFIAVSIYKREKTQILLAVVSVLATLSRQIVIPALLLPFILVWQPGVPIKKNLRYLLPLVCSGLCYLVYRWWLESSNRMPANQSSMIDSLLGILRLGKVIVIIGNIQQCVLLLGFLMFPILLLFGAREVTSLRNKKLIVCVSIMLASIAVKHLAVKSSLLFPYCGNVLNQSGFGPLDFSYESIVSWRLPLPILLCCSIMSVLGGSIVLLLVYERVKTTYIGRHITTESRLFYFSGIQLLLCFFIDRMFDRYVGVLVGSFVLTIIVARRPRQISSTNVACFIVALMLHIGFCLMAGRDYMNIQRARASAYSHLINVVKANRHSVDAGFEYNGLNNYRHGFIPVDGKPLWMDEVDYGVGLHVPPNCKELYRTDTKIYCGLKNIVIVAYEVGRTP